MVRRYHIYKHDVFTLSGMMSDYHGIVPYTLSYDAILYHILCLHALSFMTLCEVINSVNQLQEQAKKTEEENKKVIDGQAERLAGEVASLREVLITQMTMK